MIFSVDLEEGQVNATRLVAEKLGLSISECVELFVLTGVQEVVMGITSPEMTPRQVSLALREHTDRLVLELKSRRTGGSAAPT